MNTFRSKEKGQGQVLFIVLLLLFLLIVLAIIDGLVHAQMGVHIWEVTELLRHLLAPAP